MEGIVPDLDAAVQYSVTVTMVKEDESTLKRGPNFELRAICGDIVGRCDIYGRQFSRTKERYSLHVSHAHQFVLILARGTINGNKVCPSPVCLLSIINSYFANSLDFSLLWMLTTMCWFSAFIDKCVGTINIDKKQ